MTAGQTPGRYRGAVAEDRTTSRTSRVERTIAFIDLCGFTEFTDLEGDDRAVAVLSSFRDVVRTIASERGVRIAKWLGDGAMLVGVEPEPLMEAIVEIEDRIAASVPLPLRAGVTVGPVMLIDGDDYIGHAVNMASRLCGEAEAHEVLTPADAVSALLVNTHAEPVGRREIPGVGEPIEVVRLTARD